MYHSRQHVRIEFRIVTIHPHWIHPEHSTHTTWHTHRMCCNSDECGKKIIIDQMKYLHQSHNTWWRTYLLSSACSPSLLWPWSNNIKEWRFVPLTAFCNNGGAVTGRVRVESKFVLTRSVQYGNRDNLQAKVEEGTEHEKIATIV